MTAKPSPRPWTWEKEKLYRGAHVAGRMPGIFGGEDGLDKIADVFSEADAALIVQAVNSFDDLVAVKDAASGLFVDPLVAEAIEDGSKGIMIRCDVLVRLLAALRKAGALPEAKNAAKEAGA